MITVLIAVILCLVAFLLGMVASRVIIVEPMEDDPDAAWDALDKKEEGTGDEGSGAETAAAVAALGEKIDSLGAVVSALDGRMERVTAAVERAAAAIEAVGEHVKTLADETVKTNASSNEAMASAMSSPGMPSL